MKKHLVSTACAVAVLSTAACSGEGSAGCEGKSCSGGGGVHGGSGGTDVDMSGGLGGEDPGTGSETSSGGGMPSEVSGGGSGGKVDPSEVEVRAPKLVRLRSGEEGTVAVDVSRRGDVGEVEFEVTGLPSGVAMSSAKAGEDEDRIELTISSLETATVGGPYEVTISVLALDEEVSSEATFVLYVAGAPGSLDESFADSGYLQYDFLPDRYDAVLSLDVDDRGSLLVAGVAQELDPWIPWLRRFDRDGHLEADFSPEFGGNWSIRPVLSTANTISVIGRTADSTHFLRVLNRDGSPHSAFGTGGDVIVADAVDFMGAYDGLRLVGYAHSEIVRFLPDGNQDADFKYEADIQFEDGAIDPTGRVVITSRTVEDFVIMRLNKNGRVDESFADKGMLTVQGNPDHDRLDSKVIGFRDDGGFYVVLESTAGGLFADEVRVISVLEDGDLDSSFAKVAASLVNPGALGFATIDPVRGGIIASYGTDVGDVVTGHVRRITAEGEVDDDFSETDLANVDQILRSWSVLATLDGVGGRIVLCTDGQGEGDDYGAVGCARFWL